MFSFLSPYKLLIEVILIGALITGIGVGIHEFLQHEQDIGYKKAVAEYTTKELDAEKAARAVEASLREQLRKAQDESNKRDQQNAVLLAAVSNTADSLRSTTTNIRNGLSTADATSLRRTIAATLTVFEDCRSEYAKMGQAAAGHASDSLMLQQAWPK